MRIHDMFFMLCNCTLQSRFVLSSLHMSRIVSFSYPSSKVWAGLKAFVFPALSRYSLLRIFLERKAPQDKNWYYTDQMYVTQEWQHDRMLCMHSTQMCCTPPCCKCQCSSMNSTAICAAKVQKFEWPGHCRWGVVSRATSCQVPKGLLPGSTS